MDYVMDDEDFDWDCIDEEGLPKEIWHLFPHWMRRRKHWILLVYWDPIIEFLEQIPACLYYSLNILKVAPFVAFVASLIWLGLSVSINMRYKEGDCTVEKLPSRFSVDGGMYPTVLGVYTVRRKFPPSERQFEGIVFQECDVIEECHNLHTDPDTEEDRCSDFRQWAWHAIIDCFHHEDDFYGDTGKKLYCLSKPSNLTKETFTVVVCGLVCVLSFFAIMLLHIRRKRKNEEEIQFFEDAEALQFDLEQAKLAIEQRELDVNQQILEAMQRQEESAEEEYEDDNDLTKAVKNLEG